MSRVGERLREAIEKHEELSIRQFQQRMDETEVDGTSYSTVHGYLRQGSTTEPSIAFLQKAAEVLGVRPEWLVLGKGQPTHVEEVSAVPDPGEGVETGEEQARAGKDAIWRGVREKYDALWSPLPREVRSQFLETFSRYALVAEDGGQVPRDEQDLDRLVDLAGYLLWLMWTPIRAWNFSNYPMDEKYRRHGARAMLHALELFLPERRSGKPLSEFRESRQFAEWQRQMGAYEERLFGARVALSDSAEG